MVHVAAVARRVRYWPRPDRGIRRSDIATDHHGRATLRDAIGETGSFFALPSAPQRMSTGAGGPRRSARPFRRPWYTLTRPMPALVVRIFAKRRNFSPMAWPRTRPAGPVPVPLSWGQSAMGVMRGCGAAGAVSGEEKPMYDAVCWPGSWARWQARSARWPPNSSGKITGRDVPTASAAVSAPALLEVTGSRAMQARAMHALPDAAGRRADALGHVTCRHGRARTGRPAPRAGLSAAATACAVRPAGLPRSGDALAGGMTSWPGSPVAAASSGASRRRPAPPATPCELRLGMHHASTGRGADPRSGSR
jgi:hypothetical protein